MSTTDGRLTPPEPRKFSVQLPRPLWIGLTTVVLVVVAIGLRIGAPIYRQQVAIREIEVLDGSIRTEPTGPRWLSYVGQAVPD